MAAITPCLWFDTEAEEAAEFYVGIFKNSSILEVSRYGEGAPKPAGTALTVSFELDGQQFQSLNGGPDFKFNEALSFVVSCESQADVDAYWSRLTEGGQESQCGWLKDRYGLSWQIVPKALHETVGGPDPVKAQAAMQAMLQMKKLDVAELQRAYEQG